MVEEGEEEEEEVGSGYEGPVEAVEVEPDSAEDLLQLEVEAGIFGRDTVLRDGTQPDAVFHPADDDDDVLMGKGNVSCVECLLADDPPCAVLRNRGSVADYS
eukprot:7232428-Alexandrium_andersonii.AAC.1